MISPLRYISRMSSEYLDGCFLFAFIWDPSKKSCSSHVPPVFAVFRQGRAYEKKANGDLKLLNGNRFQTYSSSADCIKEYKEVIENAYKARIDYLNSEKDHATEYFQKTLIKSSKISL